MKNRGKHLILGLFLIGMYAPQGYSMTDPYPKNPNIDALNYRFEIELSDERDEILGKMTMDVRFLTDSILNLRLDLINKSAALENKGMQVTAVESNVFTIDVETEPEKIKLDPNTWVLMDVLDFVKTQ